MNAPWTISRRRLAELWMILSVSIPWGSAGSASADDWPQWLGPRRDGVWRETGILETFPERGLAYRWRVPIGGGFAGPAVVGSRVYVTDRRLAEGVERPKDPFARGEIPGTERVLCLDDATGAVVWKHEYPVAYTVSYASGPRTTPTVADGRIFTLGTEGNLIAMDAETGKVLWHRDFRKEFGISTPLWGFSGHPLLDGNKLICLAGGDGSVAVAYEAGTGKELWRALRSKEPGYAPPMIHEFDGRRHLIIWHPEAVCGLDPESGKELWTYPMNPIVRSGMSIPSPLKMGDHLFLTSFYNGSLMLRIRGDKPTVIWKSAKVSEKDTDGLHSVMATPLIEDGWIYSPCSYGQFRCLNALTGERRWETYAPTSGKSARWGHAFVVQHADRAILFSETGDLVFARLGPEKYEELGRTRLVEPTNPDPGRPVVWSHPAFAHRNVYARNDREIVSASLAK